MNINNNISTEKIFNKAIQYHINNELNLAKKTYKEVIKKNPNHIKALNNLGLLLKKAGEFEKAINCFEKTIKINPGYENAYNNLGLIFFELTKYQKAIDYFKKVIKIKPELFQIYSNIGLAYEKIGDFKKAVSSYLKVPKSDLNYVYAQYNLGSFFYKTKQYKNSAEIFSKIDYKKSKSYLLKCLFELNDRSNFLKELDIEIKKGTSNALIGSVISLSNIKYGIRKKNLFCENTLNYTRNINLIENYDFNNIFVKSANDILNDKEFINRSQPLLVNGTQSAGNIFFDKNKFIKKIENIIHLEIEKYRMHFNKSNEGLIKNWPTKYTLDGWLVKMRNGGKIKPHIHEHGWLSGSIYINVPPKIDKDSGNLIVSLKNLQNKIDNSEFSDHSKIINVETGSFCLFPASLFHYTIPFKSKEDRIVLAFDVIPN